MKRIEKFDQIPANTDIIAGIDLIGNIKQLFSLPLQAPGFIFLLCTRGTCTLTIHLTQYQLKENSLAIVAPNMFLQIKEQSSDCRFIFVAYSKELIDKATEIAKEKGIKITFIDSYTESNIQDMTVATDNLEAGKLLREYARTLLNENSRIAIVSHVKGVSTAVEREQGFREGLGDYNKNVVEVVYCNSLFDKASQLTEALIEKYPDLEMVAGMNEYSAVGAARAVQKCGKEGEIQVVGVDSSQEAVQLMEKGVFKGIVVQKAFKMGYLGVMETVRMLKGKPYDENVNSGCQLVTPENMYSSEIEKLIFPFNVLGAD